MCNENRPKLGTNTGDSVVGLNVGGRVFYTTRSTLTQTVDPTYFSKRFGVDSSIPPGSHYLDAQGVSVYFIDRNGDHFDLILDYLRMGMMPKLPNYYDNPLLWRWLREEAKFYCMDQLYHGLKLVYTCDPSSHREKGVLHWLGTNKGKRTTYQNPVATEHIRVNCWNDQFQVRDILSRPYGRWTLRQRWLEDRSVLVEHKPAIVGLNTDDMETIRSNSTIARAYGASHRRIEHAMESTTQSPLFCEGDPVEVELLGDLTLCPTHYSLRWDGDCTMYKWRLEGSIDHETWYILHKGGEHELMGPSQEATSFIIHVLQRECDISLEETNKILKDLVEEECRHTFTVEPSASTDAHCFYKYFRFISDSDTNHHCMHGVGFELYGHVCEE